MPGRQCGDTRDIGGTYLMVATSADGYPPKHFIICPPKPIILADYSIKKRGVTLIQDEDGIYHVIDYVGERYYPNTPDVFEEAEWIGFSRRCEDIDYSKLTRRSRLLLVHKRAIIENRLTYLIHFTDEERQAFKCPKGHQHHTIDKMMQASIEGETPEMCAGLWYHNLKDGVSNWQEHVEASKQEQRIVVHRPLRCGHTYQGYGRPIDITPIYHDAIFMSLPIGGIEIVGDPDDNTHVKKYNDANRCNTIQHELDVRIVEE